MDRKDIPNLISIMRIFLSIPIVWMLFEQRFDLALMLFVIAGVSDGLDGYLAKRNGWQSQLGGLLDPLADKVLLVSCFLSLGLLDLIPLWLVMLVLLRDLIIVTGALVYNFRIEELKAAPSIISKINTFTQIVLVLAVVLDKGLLKLSPQVINGLIWLVVITTIVSGVNYVWVWSRRAADHALHD